MHVNVKEFLVEADIKDTLYPGKRIVKPCKQIGEFKNHCVVVDWRDPETIKLEVLPGLSGRHLAPEMVKEYPVCFQSPTYVKIDVVNDNDDEEDEESEGKGSKGKSGGGGKKMAKKKKLEDIEVIAARFGDSAEGKVPTLGDIKEMVVMGVQLAKESFTSAFGELTKQIKQAKITTTEVLAKAAKNMVTRVEPPSFMKPKGDETAQYKYDRDKNADIGFRMSLG